MDEGQPGPGPEEIAHRTPEGFFPVELGGDDGGAEGGVGLVLLAAGKAALGMAAAALGEIGGAESRTLLVRLGRDASPPVRAAAQAALDKICDFKFT